MVRRINVAFDNEEFEDLKRRKDKLGLSWADLIRKGLECLEEKAGATGDG